MTGKHTVEGYIKGASSYAHAGKADPAFPRPALNVALATKEGELTLGGITISHDFIANLREDTDTISNGFGDVLEVTTVSGAVLRLGVSNFEMLSVMHAYAPQLYDVMKNCCK